VPLMVPGCARKAQGPGLHEVLQLLQAYWLQLLLAFAALQQHQVCKVCCMT